MANRRNRLTSHIATVASLWLVIVAAEAAAGQVADVDPDPDPHSPCGAWDYACKKTLRGVLLSTARETAALSNSVPVGSDGAVIPGAIYEYVAVIACAPNTPQQPRLEICALALQLCDRITPPGPGPLAWVYRREIAADGTQGGWDTIGTTCFADAVPPESGATPILTDAMIVEQFHQTDFALPQALMQPPDNRTLVNLPVYYQLAWPQEGFEPQEIDTTDLAGFSVRIRPTLQDVTYDFGDGSAEGPTVSLGGPYPDGDITHTYLAKASVNPSISVTYGGEVSVDGGAWEAIDASVTIDGPAVPLEVLTSRNRLYLND